MFVRALIGIVLLILIGYGVIEALPLLTGPEIRLSSPLPDQSFPEGNVLITGVAKHTETLLLNDGPLLIDEEGRFSTTLTLPRGDAILSLTASDRFRRAKTVTRTIYIP